MPSRSTTAALTFFAFLVAGGLAYAVLGERSDMLDTMLHDTYGRYDREKKTWQQDDGGLHYTLCVQREILVLQEPHLLLALCGSTAEMEGHANSGMIDLYVLKGNRRAFTLAAALRNIASGAYGQAGEVSTLQLGAQFYGFAIDEGWSGQGYTLATKTLYVPRDDSLSPALTLRTHLDNAGTSECDENKARCETLERSLTIDQQNAIDKVYPIIVSQSGRLKGRDMRGSFTLQFDRKTRNYVAPKAVDLMPE